MDDDYPMTIGDWMITMLILTIPIINIIMFLVWAFGSSGNTSRKTYCQASLLWMLILIGAAFVFGGVAPLFQELLPTE
ncbi:MAG: hypothetical protein QM496_03705 [Verrucomicrobiota bacterium]